MKGAQARAPRLSPALSVRREKPHGQGDQKRDAGVELLHQHPKKVGNGQRDDGSSARIEVFGPLDGDTLERS